MPALDFPSSPTLNQIYTANGKSFQWNGTQWVVYTPAPGDVTLNGAQVLTNKELVNPKYTPQTLVDASSIAWNAGVGQTAQVTLGGSSRVIQKPTNLKNGLYWLHVDQDATGGRTYSFDSSYKFTVAPTISSNGGSRDTYLFLSDGNELYGMQMTRRTGATPAPTPAPAVYPPMPFAMGINIHEGGLSSANNTTIANIFANRRMQIARMDLFTNGAVSNVRDQATKIRANGGWVQGVLKPSVADDYNVYTAQADLDNIFNAAYAQTTTIVNAHKDLIHDYELINEVPLRPECNAQVPYSTGQLESSYTGKTAYISIGYILRGMAKAIRDIRDATGLPLRVLFGQSSRDWGFIRYMETLGLTYDVMVWHVYPTNQQASLLTDPWWGTGGPLAQLAAFGKPITINEFNSGEIYNGTYTNASGADAEAGWQGLTKHMKDLYTQTICDIESLVFYELKDQPAQPAPENRFGLMFDLATPKVTMLLATAFAGGALTTAEKAEITNRSLLTTTEITNYANRSLLPEPTYTPPTPTNVYGVGTNLSGMEWAESTIRYGASSYPNRGYTCPRARDVAYLASTGMTKNRLPFRWERLQPILTRTNAAASIVAASHLEGGVKGNFEIYYAEYIQAVLDAHAANGMKVILDMHNYCRYLDFVYNGDGTVTGFTAPADRHIMPYTTDNTKVINRIMSLAAGATLTQADFTDIWTRIANRWKGHPGLAGFSLMNEPMNMPSAGGVTAFNDPYVGGVQDYSIWPTFAQAAINAIRATGSTDFIYVGGNDWQNPMYWTTINPGFPLNDPANKIIYDAHMYIDHGSTGQAFDYNYELSFGWSAGEINQGGVPVAGLSGPSTSINPQTAVNRQTTFKNWLTSNSKKGALTEYGMPLGDTRWTTMWRNGMVYAFQNNIEVYTWMGGNHWPIHGYPINHVPQFHQNKTLEPEVSGVIKNVIGVAGATLFDEGPGYALAGNPITITLQARGNLTSPVTVTVTSDNGGTFNKQTLTLAAGFNSTDSFTYTPASDRVATLTYVRTGGGQVPPARKVYSIIDPVARAATNLTDAANTLIAKYQMARWVVADAYDDYMAGSPCANGAKIRAISDSGYMSTLVDPMEMINWFNDDTDQGMDVATLSTMATDSNGKKYMDLSTYPRRGLWCKKIEPTTPDKPNPTSRMKFDLQNPHFAVATISISALSTAGVVFQAGQTEGQQRSELAFVNGVPRAVFTDINGVTSTLNGTAQLATNTPTVLSFKNKPGAQLLRVQGVQAAASSTTFANSYFTQMLMGGGYRNYFEDASFLGRLYGVLVGIGDPSTAELNVLEQYAASLAGITLAGGSAGGSSEAGITALYASSQQGSWLSAADPNTLYGVDQTTLVSSTGVGLGKWADKSGRANHAIESDAFNAPIYDGDSVTGKPFVNIYHPMTISGGGGGTTGFHLVMGMRQTSSFYTTRTLFSDVPAGNANAGYRVRLNSSNQLEFSAGTGSARVTLTHPLELSDSTDWVLLAWHDGASLNVQLNAGTIYSVACGTVAAGTTGCTLAGDNGVANTNVFAGRIYGMVYRTNSGMNTTDRATIRSYVRDLVGLTF